MSANPTPAAPAAKKPRDPARYNNAGATPDPWKQCALLQYGGDRSYATAVRTRVLSSAPEDRLRLEGMLHESFATPGRTEPGLMFLCQMLALVGTAKSVPLLAPILRDPKTAEAARYALEAIPGSEADATLREALVSLSGAAKAGLIGSIAMRGDVSARGTLAALKDSSSEPAIVREAAGRALEQLSKHNS